MWCLVLDRWVFTQYQDILLTFPPLYPWMGQLPNWVRNLAFAFQSRMFLGKAEQAGMGVLTQFDCINLAK